MTSVNDFGAGLCPSRSGQSVLLALAASIALALGGLLGCSSQPPTPDWKMNAHSASDKAMQASLSGDDRVANLEWDRARAEIARTGRVDLMARLELLHCAVQVASLDFSVCERFEALRPDAAAPELTYAAYLNGQPLTVEQRALLPPAQQAFATAAQPVDGRAIAEVEDSLARLVAAAVLLKTQRVDDAGLTVAVNTASEQGWRRPLLAWLGAQVQRAQSAGDVQAVEQLRRRMALVERGEQGAKPPQALTRP